MSTSLTATPVCVKSPNEVRGAAVSFSGCLETGETLTGTPTVTGHADLTLGSVAISSGVLDINGVSVPAGEAVTFSVSGGDAGQKYTITVVVTTSTGQTIERFLRLQVASS